MSKPVPVLEALELGTEQMCIDAINGFKQVSVRTNFRDYTDGNKLVLYNEQVGFVATATISSVRYCQLREVTEQECKDDGFESLEELLAVLQGFYGDSITLDSSVTVLRWRDIKGPMVDAYFAEAPLQ